MSQAELPDQGRTIYRVAKCPSCGGNVVWTVVTSHNAKVACTEKVGERNHQTACGFTMRRAEWDYLLEKPDRAAPFVANLLAAFTAKKSGR